jgi:hypothetical protein
MIAKQENSMDNNPTLNSSAEMPQHEYCKSKECLSWSAVAAGALVAIGLSILLNAFGNIMGWAFFKISPEGTMAFSLGGFSGILISAIASMFVAGWVSGNLGRKKCNIVNGIVCECRPCAGALHGFLAWCLALLISVTLATPLSQFVSLHFSTSKAVPATMSPVIMGQTYSSFENEKTSKIEQNESHIRRLNREMGDKKTADNKVIVNEEKLIHTSGLSLLLTFSLFFVGALFSCLGGYCAIRCKGGCGINLYTSCFNKQTLN